MNRVNNYTVVQDIIIPIDEFLEKLKIDMKEENLSDISFVVDEKDTITGIMINSIIAYKHEEGLPKVKQ